MYISVPIEKKDIIQGVVTIRLQTYTISLSHELKSPLTAIKSAAEILYEVKSESDRSRFIDAIAVEVKRLEKLSDSLVTLTTIKANLFKRQEESFQFSELVEEVIFELNNFALTKDIKLIFNPHNVVVVIGTRFWLKEAIKNILNNSIEFSFCKSEIKIESIVNEDILECRIEDFGVGIPEWAKPKVFDQFFSLARPSNKRRSSGLGLCIAKEAIEQNGGKISIQNGYSVGVVVTISLPVGKSVQR
jgi:two-component system, OmpR family, sensor histidine kinase CreC